MSKNVVLRNIILIIVIFIIIIIAFCFFLGAFESEDRKLFKSDVKELVDLVTQNCENEILNGLPHTSTYTIKENIIEPELTFNMDTKLTGNISINQECEISLIVYDENYKAKKDPNTLLFIREKEKLEKCTLDSEKLEIGSIVTCHKETFNVIDFDDSSVTLFSNYNVNTKINKQDFEDTKVDSINPVSFDKINNRINPNNSYCEKTFYGCNLYSKQEGIFTNGTFSGTINEDSTIKSYVDSYAVMLDLEDNLISSGLITKSQLESLGCSSVNNDCKMSNYPWIYNSTYWTSTYYDGSPSIVWRVTSDGFLGTSYANYDNYTGVRPVIKINLEMIEASK